MVDRMKVVEQFGEELANRGLEFLVEDITLTLPKELGVQLLYVSTILGTNPDILGVDEILAPQLEQYLNPLHGLLEEVVCEKAFAADAPARLLDSIQSEMKERMVLAADRPLAVIGSAVEQAQCDFDNACSRCREAGARLQSLIDLERQVEMVAEVA